MAAPTLQTSQNLRGRDQLYLDTAEGPHLNAVANNLGMRRPMLGLSGDSKFRDMVKQIAMKPKLVRDAFVRAMQVCFGPQFARASNHPAAVAAGEQFIRANDASVLTQQGYVTLSPGLAIEETIRFVYRDKKTNTLTLDKPTRFPHPVVAEAMGRLAGDEPAGSGSIVLTSTATFPVAGYPYSVLLDQGTEQEEIVVVLNNDTGTNTLTLAAVTQYDHAGPTAQFVRGTLSLAAPSGRYFVRLSGADALVGFPSAGWVRIDPGGGNEEVIEYTRAEPSTGTLYLKGGLGITHAVGESVELVRPGTTASTASVLQEGGHWNVYDAEPYRVALYIPEAMRPLNIIDASWFHAAETDPAPGADALAAGTVATDTNILCVSTAAFPDAGLYTIGATLIFAVKATTANTLNLSREIGVVYPGGTAVTLVEPVYAATDLLDGNPRDGAGLWVNDQFPGHYLFNPASEAPSAIQGALGERLTAPTRIAYTQAAGRTCLEVEDATLWPTPAFTPFDVTVGRFSGDEETLSLVDVTLKDAVATTTVAPGATWNNAGDLTLRGAATGPFPDTGLGGSPAGFRLIVDRGGGNEEIVTVTDNDAGPGDFSLAAPLALNHAGGESIELMNDVLTFSTGLAVSHAGPSWTPTRQGQLVERPYSQISITGAAAFPTVETNVWLNFGKGRINSRAVYETTIAPTILEFDDTSTFPTTDYPYPVRLSAGTYNEETMFVSNNNVGANRLTFTAAPVLTHNKGDYVTFTAGAPAVITYNRRIGASLIFDEPVYPGHYTTGETVIYSPGMSEPRDDGWSYQFFLPPDPALCLRSVLDLVRAAGVKVEVMTER
jgi:hypothetical protein